MVYYNEIEPFAAEWLRNLIKEGLIANGDVDDRSILDVGPADLVGYNQCHFFAGIGVWSYALRLAGWDDSRPCWTGSAPCQPFSTAGRQRGCADERHLAPVWLNLVRECRPDVVFGEQVPNAVRHGWLDLVFDALEGIGYACGALVTSAAGVGAPHVRKRLYFVADLLAHAEGGRLEGHAGHAEHVQVVGLDSPPSDGADLVADAPRLGRQGGVQERSREGREREAQQRGPACGLLREADGGAQMSVLDGFWRDCKWLPCRDGKFRPIEPGTFPLVDGAPARVGRLRAYGNALCGPQAAAFVAAYMRLLAGSGGNPL